nr:uncharacterized protein LOC127490938 [Oryctolagus cuniculus]XP_051700905.1 uncharacterized protein LOC127490938 [Oryctolagus cuniculus]
MRLGRRAPLTQPGTHNSADPRRRRQFPPGTTHLLTIPPGHCSVGHLSLRDENFCADKNMPVNSHNRPTDQIAKIRVKIRDDPPPRPVNGDRSRGASAPGTTTPRREPFERVRARSLCPPWQHGPDHLQPSIQLPAVRTAQPCHRTEPAPASLVRSWGTGAHSRRRGRSLATRREAQGAGAAKSSPQLTSSSNQAEAAAASAGESHPHPFLPRGSHAPRSPPEGALRETPGDLGFHRFRLPCGHSLANASQPWKPHAASSEAAFSPTCFQPNPGPALCRLLRRCRAQARDGWFGSDALAQLIPRFSKAPGNCGAGVQATGLSPGRPH